MEKERVIQAIESAIRSHEDRLKASRLMVFGMQFDEEEGGGSETSCEFGSWLYGHYEWLSGFFGARQISEIEKLHKLWHEENRKIHAIYASKKGKGFLGKLLGSGKVTEGDMDKAKAYYAELKIISEQLLHRMQVLLTRAKSFPASDYEAKEKKE